MAASAYPVAPYRGGQRRQHAGSGYQDSRQGRRKTPNRPSSSHRANKPYRLPKPNAIGSSSSRAAARGAAIFGLKLGGKVASRFIPGVGWGLLALDILSLGLAYFPSAWAWLTSTPSLCALTCKGARIINFHSCAQNTPTPCDDLMSLLNNSATLNGPVNQRFIQMIEYSNATGPTSSEWFRGQRYDRLLLDGSFFPVPRSSKDLSHMAPSVFNPWEGPKPGQGPAPAQAPQWADPFGAPAPGPASPTPDPRPPPYWARPYRKRNRYRVATETHESGPQAPPGPARPPGVRQWPRPQTRPGTRPRTRPWPGEEDPDPTQDPGTDPHTDPHSPQEPSPGAEPAPRPRTRPRPPRPGHPSQEPDDYNLDVIRNAPLDYPDNVPRTIQWQSGNDERPPTPPSRREPPRRHTKERKYRTRTYAIARGMMRVLNSVTEAKDVVDALFDALPYWTRRRSKRARAADRAAAVAQHWKDIDIEKAVKNLVLNQIEDFLYGNVGQISRKSSNRLGHDFDIHGRNARILDMDPVSGVLESFGLSL